MQAQSEVILPTRPRDEAALNVEWLSNDIFNSLQVNNPILCEPLLKNDLETKVESFEGGQLTRIIIFVNGIRSLLTQKSLIV